MDIKSLRDRLAAIEESSTLDEAGRRTAKKVAQNVFNRMTTQVGAAPLPSVARAGGKVWEPVPGVPGKYYNTANKSEQITVDELKKLQTVAPATTTAATNTATTASKVAGNFKEKGALIGNYIKSNPKLAAAIAAAAAIYAGGKALEPGKEPEPAPATAPGPAPAPAPAPVEQAPKPEELDALKKQIDTLIAELEPSKDEQVQKELARIKTKYAGKVEQGALPAKPAVANAFDIKKGAQ